MEISGIWSILAGQNRGPYIRSIVAEQQHRKRHHLSAVQRVHAHEQGGGGEGDRARARAVWHLAGQSA